MTTRIFSNLDSFYTLWFEFNRDEDDRVYAVSFKAYEITGIGKDDTIYYNHDHSVDIDPEQNFAEGNVKWDGCMNIHLEHHFCGWSKVFSNLMKDIYLQAADIMGTPHEMSGLEELKEYYCIK